MICSLLCVVSMAEAFQKESELGKFGSFKEILDLNFREALISSALCMKFVQEHVHLESSRAQKDKVQVFIVIGKQDRREERTKVEKDYKELYDALINSYNTDKDLFSSYGKAFTLKQGRDDEDKDKDPSAGSGLGTKRRKSSKEGEFSKDPSSKEGKSSSSTKGTSRSQHKPSEKSTHTKDQSYNVDDLGVQQNQEFVTGNDDEQPDDEAALKDNCDAARAGNPLSSFDELTDTLFNFSAFFMNHLNITDLTQELLVRPAFNLLKGTCKSITELEYHLEECSKATTEKLDWHNPEGKPYPFDLHKPLLLIQDRRGRQVIPQDYFINNDLEYLKGGSLSIKQSSKDVYSRRRIIAVTRLTIMKKYDYGHLDEIEVRREDQQLHTFKEGDFPRLRLQDIEDLLLLLVQYKLTNLTINERYNLNVHQRNRLMRIDELHKFSDGTLDDVRSALHDITSGIRMKYLPKKKWSNTDKRRA
ncbi:hypothetical protein Tco_1212896 [Tanacetum coccineum]